MSDHDSPNRSPADSTLPGSHAAGLGRRSAALSDRHLSKLALVYVRQSSTQQIFDPLAADLPALWHSPQTTAADRKEIVRLLVERVVVHVQADTEHATVDIAWRGGLTTSHACSCVLCRVMNP